jgi:ssDNA-binding replication factor A large subunit
MIEAIMFNEAAIKFDKVIQEGNVYVIKYGKVGIANKKFTSIQNDYSLTFDVNSVF